MAGREEGRCFDEGHHYDSSCRFSSSTATTTTTRPSTPSPGTSSRRTASGRCSGRASAGRQRLLVGGKVNRFIPNPTFDPVAAPGVMDEYFRGRNPKGSDVKGLFGELEPIRPEYRDRDARLALMDQQGMDGAILLPTLGVGMEQALIHDIPALTAAFRAFNRWLDEDWGFAYQERIFAAPYITLSDPDNAVRELEWALERDARFVVMVGGPVTTAAGQGARRRDVRRVLAAGQRRRDHRPAITAARPRTRSTCRPGVRTTSPRRSAPTPSAAWSRPMRSRTRSRAISPSVCSPGSRTCASRRSRSVRPGCSTCSRS